MSNLVNMLEVQRERERERDNVVLVKQELLKKHAYLETELAKERNIIKTWTNFVKTTQNTLESGCWREGLGYSNNQKTVKDKKLEAETTRPTFTKKAPKSKINLVRFAPKTEQPKSVNEEGFIS